MRILHTSDWHLGASLCGRKRYDEGEHFLSWLTRAISSEKIDTLIVAGDIFDSGTPSNRALEMYYRFLGRIARSGCRHVIVTAGNHDSPTLLAAPREILSALDIHVVGSVSDAPEEQVFILEDNSGTPSLIVCAVPYLRDRDIRTAEPGESIDEKKARLIDGICSHYHNVCQIAESLRNSCRHDIPIVATGHLFATGGSTLCDDGVRDLTLGNLVQVGSDAFPACIDYLALGHLHQPQLVGGRSDRRYCGSPMIMGFGEAGTEKEVVVADIRRGCPVSAYTLRVPPLRDYLQVSGDMGTVVDRIRELQFIARPVWIEVLLTDPGCRPEAREEICRAAEKSPIEVVRVKNTAIRAVSLSQSGVEESLEELDPMDVFARCLEETGEPDENREKLTHAYHEILTAVLEEDSRAE
jgi:exonuclease SbcD